MKTFQWDKVSANATASTVWDGAVAVEPEIEAKLRAQGIFDEMADDFRAKQTVHMVTKKDKQVLASVLSVQQRQRIGESEIFQACCSGVAS